MFSAVAAFADGALTFEGLGRPELKPGVNLQLSDSIGRACSTGPESSEGVSVVFMAEMRCNMAGWTAGLGATARLKAQPVIGVAAPTLNRGH